MSTTGFVPNLGAQRPTGPIQADPDPVSVVLPPNWRESLDIALPKARKKLDETNKEAGKTVNLGYMFLGGLLIATGVYLIVYKWRKI
jgi:hypothetical protein